MTRLKSSPQQRSLAGTPTVIFHNFFVRLTNISTTHHWMEETDRPTIYIFYEKPFEDRQEPNPIVTNDSQWWHWPCSSRHVTHVGKERHSGPFFLLISGASFFRFAADPSIIQDLCTTAEGSFSLSLCSTTLPIAGLHVFGLNLCFQRLHWISVS